jgi:DNA-binding Lrp family transcriptional regulator
MALDDIDTVLLTKLRSNARLPVAALARALGVTRITVQARLTRLEERGIITGYTIMEPPSETGVRAHVSIRILPQAQEKVEKALSRLTAVQQLYSVSGGSDLIAVVAEQSTAALDTALDKIRGLDGVQSTESAILLREKWRRGQA